MSGEKVHSLSVAFPDADEVHLWQWRWDGTAVGEDKLRHLSSDERERGERLRIEERRHAFYFFRSALREALSHYVGCESVALRFQYGTNGKPSLANEHGGPAFNLAHRGDRGILAVSAGGEIGVDLEVLEDGVNSDSLAEMCLSSEERSRYDALPTHERGPALLRAWTRKEAFLKAIGCGITRPLPTIRVTFLARETPRLLDSGGAERADEYVFAAWSDEFATFAVCRSQAVERPMRLRFLS